MEKTKDKESISFEIIRATDIHQLLLLANGLQASVLAIQKYDNISTFSKIMMEFIMSGFESPEQSKPYVFNKKATDICKKILGTNKLTASRIISYVIENREKVNISKIQSLEILHNCCFVLSLLKLPDIEIEMTKAELWQYEFLEAYLIRKSSEAIGYWKCKLEYKKRGLIQETKQQQEAIKEKYVTETWLKLINNPTEKKVLESLSQNKIAKRIQEKVIPDLKNVKTATGKFVLTRTKKIDEEGKTILSGLSIDTIIAIMRKQDKFKFNPFKK